MTQDTFRRFLAAHESVIGQIKDSAHRLHDSVNQHYDGVHPYSLHLDMVADSVYRYGYIVCVGDEDVLPLLFGAYFHDSIEDARLTYNDVMKIARKYMGREQALMATEIVYALTNDKGRTRAERAGEKYYQGIRETPYAPFVKLADRLANITYSCTHDNNANRHMREVYRQELPHFLANINVESDDPRMKLPQVMIDLIHRQIG